MHSIAQPPNPPFFRSMLSSKIFHFSFVKNYFRLIVKMFKDKLEALKL